MPTLLQKVKSKMFIFAHRKARGLLDGEYVALQHGRSLDFDDLRQYVPGDEVRDIDWKATARHGSPLIKRYIAHRRQNVLLVADTGMNTSAESFGGEPKRELVVLALGLIGYLALRHGDQVGLVHGDAQRTTAVPAALGEAHLEQLLQRVDRAAAESTAASDIFAQLRHIADTERSRRLIFVVADESPVKPEHAALLRRLRVQHEILWLVIRDADLADDAERAPLQDVATGHALLELIDEAPALTDAYLAAEQDRHEAISALLAEQRIAGAWVQDSATLPTTLFGLLERHRRAYA